MKRAAFMVAAAVVMAACAGSPATSPSPSTSAITHTVTGTLTFTEPNPPSCDGAGGYADIRAGADILVVDGAGATIGKGSLSRGAGNASGGCDFAFRAEDVPDVPFYSVRIGSRDGPTWSVAEMADSGWTVALTLGS